MEIDNFLRKYYTVITIWEHEFDGDKNLKSVTLEEFDLVEPPKLRDAFYGGRCEPVKLIYDFKNENEQGKYIDVVSLYPTVMFYDKYPIGYPKRIIKPKRHDKNWFGFIYCKVLPPRSLYLPVLPYKQKTKQAHKLMFGLCRTCMDRLNIKCEHDKKTKCNPKCTVKQCSDCKEAKQKVKDNCQTCYNERNSDCKHSDSERAITGFWTTTELNKAIEKGYKCEQIYEVLHFENTSTDLWKDYIKKFMKIKLETSPFSCSEGEYREKAKKFDIELDKLEENPGLRFIAKICLNSLWGKF